MSNTTLRNQIVMAAQSSAPQTLLMPFHLETDRQNQLLFFFKPECFQLPRAGQEAVIDLIIGTFERFGIEIRGTLHVSGPTLQAWGAMDKHYGFINKLSRSGSTLLSTEDRAAISKTLEVPKDITTLGGHEVLQQFPSLTAAALDRLWAQKTSRKLRSGFYIEQFVIEKQPLVVINGFHPYQLEHFTARGRSLVLVVLHTDLPWKFLRTVMLGDTFPERARAGSIRRLIHDRATELGFREVTIANNCCHLSAGPFEAAYEVTNFLGCSELINVTLAQTRVARLVASASRLSAAELVANPTIPSLRMPLFDATEEVDTLSAVSLARHVFQENRRGVGPA